jgi:hypothetical protein
MIIIVAHHYVVNSGLRELIQEQSSLTLQSVFLLIFGWGGKTGINCFVLITGYFMCTSNITLKKFLKLILEIEFYNIIFYLIFLISGYDNFSIKGMLKSILPITSLTTNFTGCYLVFFLFIPFLNILIKNMSRKQHTLLIILCLVAFSILPNLKIDVNFSYVSWFMVIYFIGSYIRLYPNKWFDSKKFSGVAVIISLMLSWGSVLAVAQLSSIISDRVTRYTFFIADSNKVLAVATAVSAFLFFKNLNIKYNKVINTIAASAFGVLLIHANSDTMRQWLWKDTLNNVGMFNSKFLFVHAIVSVAAVYIVCTLIDILRIRFLEKPFFKWYDKKSN